MALVAAAASVADSVVDLEGVASEVGEASAVVTAADLAADVEVLATKVEEVLAEGEVGTEAGAGAPTGTAPHPQMHQLDLVAAAASVVDMVAPLMVA